MRVRNASELGLRNGTSAGARREFFLFSLAVYLGAHYISVYDLILQFLVKTHIITVAPSNVSRSYLTLTLKTCPKVLARTGLITLYQAT